MPRVAHVWSGTGIGKPRLFEDSSVALYIEIIQETKKVKDIMSFIINRLRPNLTEFHPFGIEIAALKTQLLELANEDLWKPNFLT